MPVKIRLMRIGAKKRPFYRVVAVDERKKRTGAYLELLGTYNPLTDPKEIILKKDRIEYWTKAGAVASEGYLRIIGKAPQRPARKPKKDKQSLRSEDLRQVKEAAPAPEIKATTEEPTEIPVETETPTEEAVATEPAAPTEETTPEPVETTEETEIKQ